MRSNDDKLEMFADVLEPAGRIIADKAWALKWQAGDKIGAIREAIKGHKADIVEILARIDGLALFMRLVTLFNRPDLEPMSGLFTSRAQNGGRESSGPATENTGDGVN